VFHGVFNAASNFIVSMPLVFLIAFLFSVHCSLLPAPIEHRHPLFIVLVFEPDVQPY
jgi:hypothetical protein